jgi:hypothetical protein
LPGAIGSRNADADSEAVETAGLRARIGIFSIAE